MTGGFGKWHMTPDREQGPAGPFEHWPQNWGFNHFWGFLSGAAGQWDPMISQDNTTIGVPEGKDGEPYYFPEDLTDKSVEWLHGVRAQDPEKPWFLYYSTGCAHAPHHVAAEWADKYKGKFDQGWDAIREEVFERQKKLGVIPQDAELTPRPDLFQAWDSLDEASKKLYTRQMEVYAGFMDNADWNVGRLLDAVEEMGDLEDTLIFYIWGDNGASLEGTETGSFNEMTFLNGVDIDPAAAAGVDRQVRRHRGLGQRPHGPAHRGRLGVGRQHAVPVGQADGEPPGRDAQPDGRRLAREDRGGRRPALAVHALHRHRADDPRSGRDPGAEGGRRDRAAADGRHQLPVHVRRPERRGASHRAVLRGDRLTGDLQGRLVGLRPPRQEAMGVLARGARAVRPRQVGSRAGHLGAVLPAGRLHPGEGPRGREPGEARRAEGALLGGGGAQQRAAAARLDLRLLRHPAAAPDRDPLHVRGRRPERPEGTRPPRRRTLLRYRGGARGSRRAAPRASSSPTPTSSAASGSGSTRRASSTTPTRSSASRATGRRRQSRSRPAKSA